MLPNKPRGVPRVNETREFLGLVEQVQRRKIVGAAYVVLAALASAEQNAAVVAGRRLGHLQVIAVERDFAGNGDASLGGAKIVTVARQAERGAVSA